MLIQSFLARAHFLPSLTIFTSPNWQQVLCVSLSGYLFLVAALLLSSCPSALSVIQPPTPDSSTCVAEFACNMAEYRLPMHQTPPRRKPAPINAYSFRNYDTPSSQQLYPHPPPAHSRTRTSSSSVLPTPSHQQQYQSALTQQHSMAPPMNYPPSRRLSSETTSTSSGGNNQQGTHASSHPDLRRSTSSRSANAQLGYVALLRRQKGTVWCDRSQAEDPRVRAQKMAQKKRAYLEVHGAGSGRSTTLGSGKIKHGGRGGTDFSPSTLVGGAVPVRLSANEVGDADEHRSEDAFPRRPGSARSSQGSGSHRYPSGYQRPQQGNSSPPNAPNEKADLPEVSENPAPKGDEDENDRSTEDDRTSSSIQEDNFGTLGEMGAPSAAVSAAQNAQKAEELRRRGSVDDRTTSSNVRLFIANPDLDD